MSASSAQTRPVSRTIQVEATAKHTAQHDGQTYYFCAPGCKKAFEADPQKYLDPGHIPSMGGHGH